MRVHPACMPLWTLYSLCKTPLLTPACLCGSSRGESTIPGGGTGVRTTFWKG